MAEEPYVWRVRNMEQDTVKKIKSFALEHDLTVPQTIKELVELALEVWDEVK